MSMTSGSSVEENHLGIKLKGDLGDFHVQIVEEKSESEDDEDTVVKDSRALGTLSTLPHDVVKPSAPVFGSVAVSNSENVQIGNNTYFNGPVTIKQVVQNNLEHDNPGYEKTEDETFPVPQKSDSIIQNESSSSKFKVKLWLQLVFSALCFIVVGGTCTILFITLSNQTQSTGSPDFNQEETASTDPLLIAPNHLRIVARTDWLAKPVEKPLDVLRLPAPWVIITHTDTEGCTYQSECVLRVRLIQTFHVESRKWFDIGYNFLVAGDGSAYYGRGWDFQGAHTLGYNKYSIGIAFVGTFNTYPPPKKQIDAAQKLIKRGVELGKIAKDYKLFGHRQLASTLSPGDKLFDIIKEWPHFVKNDSDISELVPNY